MPRGASTKKLDRGHGTKIYSTYKYQAAIVCWL